MAQVWTKERGRGGARRWRRRRQGAETDGESGGPLPSEERRKSTGSSNPASSPRAGAAASEKEKEKRKKEKEKRPCVRARVRESAKRERRACPAGEDGHVATRVETPPADRSSPRRPRSLSISEEQTRTPRVKPFLRPAKGWVRLSANGRKGNGGQQTVADDNLGLQRIGQRCFLDAIAFVATGASFHACNARLSRKYVKRGEAESE